VKALGVCKRHMATLVIARLVLYWINWLHTQKEGSRSGRIRAAGAIASTSSWGRADKV